MHSNEYEELLESLGAVPNTWDDRPHFPRCGKEFALIKEVGILRIVFLISLAMNLWLNHKINVEADRVDEVIVAQKDAKSTEDWCYRQRSNTEYAVQTLQNRVKVLEDRPNFTIKTDTLTAPVQVTPAKSAADGNITLTPGWDNSVRIINGSTNWSTLNGGTGRIVY